MCTASLRGTARAAQGRYVREVGSSFSAGSITMGKLGNDRQSESKSLEPNQAGRGSKDPKDLT